jgi:hypothetical protein
MKIKIAQDFSIAPGSRYITEGMNSGEEFRKNLLYPKLKEAIDRECQLEVDLDGVAGYGTSFLEESFGGLIRENKVPLDVIKRTIKLISHEEPSLLDEINEYLEDAHKELKP